MRGLGLFNADVFGIAGLVIAILDRPKLEAQACECYDIVRRQYDTLLSELNEKAAS
jgi:hypothetical protein